MFSYYVPAGIGPVFTALSVEALLHANRYRRLWPWTVALLAALLLWVPALALFLVAPHLWPRANDGASDAYHGLMSWQIAWIFLGIPVGLVAALSFTFVGERSVERP